MAPRPGNWLSYPGSPAASPSHQGADGQLQGAARLGKLKEGPWGVATACDRPDRELSK
ncbi:MAG TPA: hypothetical protein V6C46_02845 [Coleofasciculaceae cyanobacterium]